VNQAMRQRLVGILVLGSLALIFVQIFLDGEGIVAPPLATQIPTPPAFDNAPVAEPTRPVINEDQLTNTTVSTDTSELSTDLPTVTETTEPSARPASANANNAADNKAPDALEEAVAAVMAKGKAEQQRQAASASAVAANAAITTDPTTVASSTARTASADSVPKRDSNGLPESFVVRLGSFADAANAQTLLAKLLAANYKAYSRTVTTANGQLQAVYVGPLLTRAEANNLLGKLNSSFQVQGVVEVFTLPTLP
jgi:DedD protein